MVLPGEIFGASLRRPKLRPAKYAPVSAANTRNSTNSNLSEPFGNACRVAIEISVLAIINWPASAITGVAILPASGLRRRRSEEHTSELQSLMRISYAVFCLKKKKNDQTQLTHQDSYNRNTTLMTHPQN